MPAAPLQHQEVVGCYGIAVARLPYQTVKAAGVQMLLQWPHDLVAQLGLLMVA